MTIVAIIGSDGCGKTTQAKMLVDRLNNKGCKSIYIRPIFILLNIITRSKDHNLFTMSPRKVRLVQNSDKYRKSLLILLGYPYALVTYIFMKFYLSRYKIIICDRYFYQFFFDIFGRWSEYVTNIFPKPDITFFIDVDLDILYIRMDDSFDASVNRDYYIQVINLYKRISKRYGFININGSLSKYKINDLIFSYINQRL